MSSRAKPLDWSQSATRELIQGLIHIAEDSPQGARLVKGRIDRAGRFLEQNPRMGKPGAVAGTREYPVPKTRYTLIYEEGASEIHILHCWHQSRQRIIDGA
jgi:toxin ParE1/3/4